MAASISFHADSFGIVNLAGSGLGFYGSSFGSSVDVGSYQDTTFLTNSDGTTQGPQVNNIKWTHPASGSINGAASVSLLAIPNYLATLQIKLTSDTAVRTQNAKLRIYDRSSINNPASGVTCKVAELIHPGFTQVVTGSGSSSWQTPTGSSVILSLMASPGVSGLSPNGPSTSSVEHSWHCGLSCSPDSVGSKTSFALFFSTEYL